jgi:hypothetical protein
MNKSGIVGMIVVLSAAMLGLTIVNMYGAQHVNAKSDVEFLWCYSSPISPNNSMCSIDHEECTMLQSADDDAKSDCMKKKSGS